jgi:peptidoglycan/LPS O-acetylase OafA/YrhL
VDGGERVGVMEKRANNFDFLRFALATAVIYSHSYYLLLGHDRGQLTEPFNLLTHGQGAAGDFAVNGFFAISGFLIFQSLRRSPSFWAYLQKRVARIYPAYLVCGGLCFVLILAMRSLTLEVSPRPVARLGISLLSLNGMDFPGAFPHLPLRGIVNGSAWTIIYEFWCYLFIALAEPLVAWRRVIAPVLLGLFIGFSLTPHLWPNTSFFCNIPILWCDRWPRFMSYFLAGVCAALYWRELPLQRWVAALAALLLILAAGWGKGLSVVGPVAGSYLLLRLAYTPRLPAQQFGRRGDFSYGLYLYAWPVQQTLIASTGSWLTPATLFASAFTVTLILAVGSWHLIERPFLQMKPH